MRLKDGVDVTGLQGKARELHEGLKDLFVAIDFSTGYSGEAAEYGTDGWRVAQDVFRVAADIAMSRFDPDSKLGPQFNMSKLIHCICNPVLGAWSSEYLFYMQRVLEMLGLIAPGTVLVGHADDRQMVFIPRR